VTPQQASAAWQKRQAQILKATYVKAWKAGVRNYQSQTATPPANRVTQPQPTTPPVIPMQRALAPALASLASMGAQLAVIVPTAEQLAVSATIDAAIILAIRSFIAANTHRVAGGVSAAWSGEQHGYAQAADADGLLLEWTLDDGAHHCDDCPALAGLPPMPLAMWPTLPGEGATECNVGCKCSIRAVAAVPVPLTALQHQVVSRVGNRQPVLVAA